MLKYLDTTCIDKNIKDCDGNNAYLYASYNGQIDVLKYFKNKLDIHIKNAFGRNAYFAAALKNNIDMMIYLESVNFNIYEKDNNGFNVYQSVCRPYITKIPEYLENKFLYSGFSKICSICYGNKKDKFITCKNNHIVHLYCQRLKNRHRCLKCSFKYLI